MPALTTREATEKIARAVETMSDDDLLDFYNEIFPGEREAELSPPVAGAAARSRILEYMSRGLETEEILDLWNVAFPEASNVHYEDEDRKIHYSELSEPIRPSE